MFSELFLRVLNRSMTAALMVPAVLILRLFLRKAPRIFSYLLWSAVLFRLLCPISYSSSFSLLNLVDLPAAEAETVAGIFSENAHTEKTDIPYPAENAEEEPVLSDPGIQVVPDVDFNRQQDFPQNAEFSLSRSPVFLMSLLWFFGVGVMGVMGLVSFIRLRRKISCSMQVEKGVYLTDHIAAPFVFGVFRPGIYLPSFLEERERGYIILHERHHIRRGDHVIKLLAYAALCIHWFNPLVWLAFALSGKDMEMSCDEAVMKKSEHDIRAEYARSLLRLAAGKNRLSASFLAFGEGNPKDRIKNVMRYKRPAVWIKAAAVAVCIAAAFCLFTDGEQKEEIRDDFPDGLTVFDGFRMVKEIEHLKLRVYEKEDSAVVILANPTAEASFVLKSPTEIKYLTEELGAEYILFSEMAGNGVGARVWLPHILEQDTLKEREDMIEDPVRFLDMAAKQYGDERFRGSVYYKEQLYYKVQDKNLICVITHYPRNIQIVLPYVYQDGKFVIDAKNVILREGEETLKLGEMWKQIFSEEEKNIRLQMASRMEAQLQEEERMIKESEAGTRGEYERMLTETQ